MLSTLNNEQLEAVKTIYGPTRLVAGAGSGKTNSLTKRFAYLIKEIGVSPDRILSVTFTIKSSREMKERIEKLVPGTVAPYVSTFHSFCSKFLREEIYRLNYPINFKVIDTSDQKEMLASIYKDFKIKNKDVRKTDILNYNIVNYCKSPKRTTTFKYEELMESLTIEEFDELIKSEKNIEDKIVMAYLRDQKKDKALDFEDLLNFTLYILKKFPQTREKWQSKFDYVQVDEFQDVSKRELELIKILADKKKNVFVVGDSDQTIYSFRGSDSSCFIEFDKLFSENTIDKVKTLFLNKNYRSTPEIIEISNNLISHNNYRIDKSLIANRETGSKVYYENFSNRYEQARFITGEIENLIKTNKYNYSDISILYRTNMSSKIIEEILNKKQMPFIIIGSVPFFQRKEIKLILAVFSVIEFEDDISIKRLLNEIKIGIGPKKIANLKIYSRNNECSLYKALCLNINEKLLKETKAYKLKDLIEETRKIYKGNNIEDAIDFIVNTLELQIKYEELEEEYRLDNINKLRDQMIEVRQNYEEKEEDFSLIDYLNDITLLTSKEEKEDTNKISCMTIHASKGLEFPVVFVIDVIEDCMPIGKCRTVEDLEEERRIAYVAFTRAEDLLYILSSEGYNFKGRHDRPSRFIDETKKNKITSTI